MRSLYVVEEKVHYGLSRYTETWLAIERQLASVRVFFLLHHEPRRSRQTFSL